MELHMSSRIMVHCKDVPVIISVSPAALHAAFLALVAVLIRIKKFVSLICPMRPDEVDEARAKAVCDSGRLSKVRMCWTSTWTMG